MTLKYLVDSIGDHTAPYLELVDECQRVFNDINELMVFANECTSVVNLTDFIPDIDFEHEELLIDEVEIESYSDFKEYPQLEEFN
jgi:hypothetical protein